MGQRSVTIRDVAAKAGLSKSTVSKYLTSTPYVSEEAKQRIEAAVTELGYRPSGSARALVAGDTRYIGVLVPSIANPYQADVLRGIEHEATPRNLGTLLAIADHDVPRERDLLSGLLRSGADGLVVTTAHAEDTEVLALRRAGIPIVLAGRHIGGNELDAVVIDNHAGARIAVEHLAELGHQRIAHVPGPRTVLDFAERADGYAAALADRGLAELPMFGSEESPHPDAGRGVVRQIIEQPVDERPTALFAAADWIAVGIIAEAVRHGLDVPGDLSVIGFDNISFCDLATVPLSTIDACPETVGRKAVERLAERISDGYGDSAIERVVLDPALVERASTGPPKA